MSGFELEHQEISAGLEKASKNLGKRDELCRELIEELKKSADVEAELAKLYNDRPVVYARVMQHLTKVLSNEKLRKLHTSITKKSQSFLNEASKSAEKVTKIANRAPNLGKTVAKASEAALTDLFTESGSSKSDAPKRKTISFSIPDLGIANIGLDILEGQGSVNFSCDGWGCPFLNMVSGTASISNMEIQQIKVQAGLKGKFLKEGGNNMATITVVHENGTYIPSGKLTADLDIPGIEGLSATFNVGASENAKMTANVKGTARLFNNHLECSPDMTITVGQETEISGKIDVKGSTGGLGGDKTAGGAEGASPAAAAGAPGGEKEEAAAPASGPVNFDGSISIATKGGELSGVNGTISVSNLGFLANPEDSVKLSVGYNEGAFSASIESPVTFSDHTLTDKKTTVALTINNASYSAEKQLCAECSANVKFGGLIDATANVNIENNSFSSGSVDISVKDFALPDKKSSLVTGSISGSVGFDPSGFTGATGEGKLNLKLGSQVCELQFSNFNVQPDGTVSGHVEQLAKLTYGCVDIEQFKGDFSSACDEIFETVTGKLHVTHPNLKSDENGIDIGYGAKKLTANGNLSFSVDGKKEFGTCAFRAAFDGSGLEANGTLQLSQDYQVGDSQLEILTGATAEVGIVNEKLNPIVFNGNYRYGYVSEGKEGAKEGGEGDKKQDLKLFGSITNCTFDPDKKTMSGSATADLDCDITIGNEKKAFFTLMNSKRKSETKLEIAFKDNKLTSVGGTIAAEGGIKLKNDTLKLEGYLKKFDYNIEGKTFSGIVDVGLNENFDLDKNKTVVLQGKKQNGVKVTLKDNEVTAIEADLDVEFNPKNKIFKGKPKFDCEAKNIQINPEDGNVNCKSVLVKNCNDTVMAMHEQKTELTLKKGSSLAVSIVDSEPETFNGDITYVGKTSVFSKGKRFLDFDGLVNVNVVDVKNPDAGVTGNVKVNVSKDYLIDEIPEVDKILLKKDTHVDFDVTEKGLQEISGEFCLLYEYSKGQKKFLPDGLKLDLKGKNLVYDVPANQFSGDIECGLAEKCKVLLSKDGRQNCTIFATTGLKAKILKNDLKKLHGDVDFKANFEVDKKGGKIDITKGKADIDFDCSGSDIVFKSISVKANTTCDFMVGETQVVTPKDEGGVDADCLIDPEGLASASIKGGVHVKVPVNKETLDLVVAADGDGVVYNRGEGIDGEISVTCEKETKLGSFNRTDAEGKTTVFNYGLGKADGEEGQSDPAAKFTATLVSNKLKSVSGQAGFFLRQDVKEDALRVTGKLQFDCDIEPEVNLNMAQGDVKIERKVLYKSTESLVLGESTATLKITNNKLESLSGRVELLLNDMGGQNTEKAAGDYLKFTTTGEFDCLDSKTFTGDVDCELTREKQLGKNINTKRGPVGLFLSPQAGPTGFHTHIEQNNIEKISGSIGAMTKLNNEPFFSGAVNGTYTAASATAPSRLDATGTITLEQDLGFPSATDTKFCLAKGSSGTAKIENNEISEISGKLIVKIAAPGKKLTKGGSCVTVTAEGTVDVKNALIKKFQGEAKLSGGEFQLFDGLSLTKLGASVLIENNDLKEISGTAGIKYSKKGFVISGDCKEFVWRKGGEGAQDGFKFIGQLDVTAMEGKLKGTAKVNYNALTNPNACPEFEGKLSYQFNKWLGGEIGLKFAGSGWDDPILSGKLMVKDAELIHARQLLGFNPDPIRLFNMQFAIGPVPIVLGAGIALGASVDLDAVKFSAEFGIEDFHLGKDKGMPKFKTDLKLTSGLNLKASVSPYVSLAVGVAGVLEAGVKVKGVASLNANAGLSLDGLLEGGENGLSGELGLGLDLKGGIKLQVIPSVFASLLNLRAEADICHWDFDLGQLFSFSWGKRFKFGPDGTSVVGDAPKQTLTPQTNVDTSAEAKEDVGSDSKPKDNAQKQEDGPELPSSKQVADDANQSKEGGDKKSEFADKVEKIKKIATAFGNITEAVKFIVDLVQAAIVGNVAGVVLFLAIKIIKGELKLSEIPQKVQEIKEGIQALVELIKENPDFIKKIIPEWLLNVIDFFKNRPTLPDLCDKVVKKVEEKVKALGSPLDRILQPLVDFVKKQRDKIVEIYELFQKGGTSNIVKGIFRIVGLGFSSAMDLVDALSSMWHIVKDVVRECINSGYIYVKVKEGRVFDHYYWQVAIPNLCQFNGDGKLIGCAVAKSLLKLLGKLGLKEQKI